MVYGGDVVDLHVNGNLRIVELGDGTTLVARAVVVASGVSYRTLDVRVARRVARCRRLLRLGDVPSTRSPANTSYVVGGGNSAGQAAMHLAQYAKSVTIVVRSNTLAASMSDYLVKSIGRTPNLDIRYATEVVDGGGHGRLEWIDLKDRTDGTVERVEGAGLFVLIGAEPCTDWLPPTVTRDAWGYLATGGHCDCHFDTEGGRAPLMFETTMSGVFAIGDARQGSVKRVASAAGEGAVCVRLIHEYLDRHERET